MGCGFLLSIFDLLRNEDLKQTIQQNESVIHMLQMQLHQSQSEREAVEDYQEVLSSLSRIVIDFISLYLLHTQATLP